MPFAFSGALIGAMLSNAAANAGHIYGANLIGSAIGAFLAPLVIGELGSEQTVLLPPMSDPKLYGTNKSNMVQNVINTIKKC